MNDHEDDPHLPAQCVDWCRSQDYSVVVSDDIAPVDLDWWNDHLDRRQLPVRLWARDEDGSPIATGRAYIRRGDLARGALPDDGPEDLCTLYRAAAWLAGHPARSRAKRFIDVRTPARGVDLQEIVAALRLCNDIRFVADGRNHDPSPWPKTPGVGPALLSLYCWATHPTAQSRPQLLDQQSLSTLCFLGWLEVPSISGFTRTRYFRYSDLLNRWAAQADVSADLIEMWLAGNWRERRHAAGKDRMNNVF